MSRSIDYIVVHHSASELITTMEDIKGWHIQRDFNDIGYHYVIEATGLIKKGRDFFKNAAANPPLNQECVAICVVGNNCAEGAEWTNEQKVSLEILIDCIRVLFPEATVIGHKEVIGGEPTLCPGIDLDNLIIETEDPEEWTD